MNKYEMRIFEDLSKGVGTRFGLRPIEKLLESLHFIFCSAIENRLGSIKLLNFSPPTRGTANEIPRLGMGSIHLANFTIYHVKEM